MGTTGTTVLAAVAVGLCYAVILVACLEGYLEAWSKALWTMIDKIISGHGRRRSEGTKGR